LFNEEVAVDREMTKKKTTIMRAGERGAHSASSRTASTGGVPLRRRRETIAATHAEDPLVVGVADARRRTQCRPEVRRSQLSRCV